MGCAARPRRADAAFVAELAQSLGLPLDLGRWQPTRRRPLRGRRPPARYEWLTQVARARGAAPWRSGTHATIRPRRSCTASCAEPGPRGLAGIPARRTLATEPETDAGPAIARRLTPGIREFLSAIGNRSGKTRPTPCSPAPAAASATTCCPSWRRSITRLSSRCAGSARCPDGARSSTRSSAMPGSTARAARSSRLRDEAVVLKHGFLRSTPAIPR